MALDSTVGGSTSDSYVDLTYADTYFANHYITAKATRWAALVTAQKEFVLRRACQTIDGLRVLDREIGYGALPPALSRRGDYDFTLHRLEIDQVLNFPRNIDVDSSNVGYIQKNVMDAQCEQADYHLTFDESPLITRMSGISAETISAGPVRIHQDFKDGGTMIAPMALELMRQFLRPSTSVQRA